MSAHPVPQTPAAGETPAASAPSRLSPECRDALERLSELLDHSMAEPDADVVRSHLETCDPCTEAADVEEHMRLLIRRACSEKAPDELRLRITSLLVRTFG